MIGDETKELERLKFSQIFKPSELEFLDFLINKNKLPSYIDNPREYQIMLRLKKKLKKAKEMEMILSNLFTTIEKIQVSSKLTGEDVVNSN